MKPRDPRLRQTQAPEREEPGRALVVAFYVLMVVAAVLVFLWIRSAGEALLAPAPAAAVAALTTAAPVAEVATLFHVLLSLSAVILTARVMGRVFALIHQPPAVGEVLGGIMLGPSLLGRVAPNAFAGLLPPSIAPFLGMHAQLGIMLYMFIIGLELDTSEIRRSGHRTLAISHASITVPFILGSALALVIYPLVSTSAVSFTVFALFIGVSMSITAFPMLARILTDLKLSRSPMGTIALTCAAIDDVTAWCLLALVAGIAQARAVDAVWTAVLTLVFVVTMAVVIAPLVRRLLPRFEQRAALSHEDLAVVIVAMLASAMATEYIGVHGIFGAFVFGAIIPRSSRLVGELRARLEDVVAVLFLPAFFAFTGMRTEVGLLAGWNDWLICGAVILVACAGKFGGTALAARLTGLGWRDASALGVLMNTRGLVGLIVLNIGLDLGVISPRFFTMLVVMAVTTTVMTAPLLHWILRRQPWTEEQRVSA